MAVAVILLAQALSALSPQSAVVWGSCALAAWCTGLICLISVVRGGDGLGLAEWKLGAWMLAWCAVTSGLATIAWSPIQQDGGAEIGIQSILRALWLIALAMTALAAGYSTMQSRAHVRAAGRLMAAIGGRYSSDVRSATVPWLLYATGFAARMLTAALTGRLGYVGDAATAVSAASGYQQALNLLSLMAPLAVAVSAVRTWREHARGAALTTAILFTAEVAFGAVAGGKQNYVTAVLAVAVPYTAARRRLPKVMLAVALSAFVLLVIPFTTAYRGSTHSQSGNLTAGQAASGAPGVLRQITADMSPLVLPQSLSYLAQRVQEIDGPAIIMQRTPSQIPFANSAQLAEAPAAALIPRALWRGKPVLAAGYEFSQEYYNLPATVYTYSAITPAGDLYRHGGWIPLIVGMFALGFGVRILDNGLDVRKSPHAVLLVLLLFPALVKAESDWVSLLAATPGWIAIWLVAVRFSFTRIKRSTGSPARSSPSAVTFVTDPN
jgi:hypothetical protein